MDSKYTATSKAGTLKMSHRRPLGWLAKDAVTRLKSKAAEGPRGRFAAESISSAQIKPCQGSTEINMLIHKLSYVIITKRNSNYKRH